MKNNSKIKIVAIGGGTGLSTLLKGLKEYPWDISAIVTMTDDGLSTGRLRHDFGILPPGDIRKCIIALSNEEDLLTKLFEYRFRRGKGLSGHSLGNLLMLALEKNTGSFKKAIRAASKILAIRGRVIPSTYEKINLIAYHKSGKKTVGERRAYLIGKKDPIKNIILDKEGVEANPEAVKAIANADIIIIGPGSLFTSIISNFLIKNIMDAVSKNKKAKKIYICNVSTERGETQGYSVEDHINKITEYLFLQPFDICLVNNKILKSSKKEYKIGEIKNITTEKKEILGAKIVNKDIINKKNPLCHDSSKLAKEIWRIANE
jgi:uncharacterized cofD-like protein